MGSGVGRVAPVLKQVVGIFRYSSPLERRLDPLPQRNVVFVS